jgi:hypothetical protein
MNVRPAAKKNRQVRAESTTADSLPLSSDLVFEVLILKDVWRGADEAKTHLVFAGFAIREVLTADHYDFMRLTMIAVMNDLVNSGLAHAVAGAVPAIVGASSAVSWTLETGALKPKLLSLKPTARRGPIKTRVSRACGQNHGNPRHHYLLAVC